MCMSVFNKQIIGFLRTGRLPSFVLSLGTLHFSWRETSKACSESLQGSTPPAEAPLKHRVPMGQMHLISLSWRVSSLTRWTSEARCALGPQRYKHLRLASRTAASQWEDEDATPRDKALETLGFSCQHHLSKGRRGDKRKVFLNLILTSKEKPPGVEATGILEEGDPEGRSL